MKKLEGLIAPKRCSQITRYLRAMTGDKEIEVVPHGDVFKFSGGTASQIDPVVYVDKPCRLTLRGWLWTYNEKMSARLTLS